MIDYCKYSFWIVVIVAIIIIVCAIVSHTRVIVQPFTAVSTDGSCSATVNDDVLRYILIIV